MIMTRNLPYDRAKRVADEIHHIIVQVCYNEIADPRLRGVEITAVRMTKDLQIARVYFYLEKDSDENRKKAQRGLESASGFFKRAVGQELTLRYMPAFEFFFDETIELEKKIEEAVRPKDKA